ETVPRVGYRFVADVREIREEPAPLIVEKLTLSRTVIEEEFVADGPSAHEERDVSVPRRLVTRPVPAFLHQHATATAVVLIAVSLALGAIFYLRANKPTSPGAITSIRSVAVLPPRSLSGKAEDAPLSLGVADALITRLGGLRRVVVRPTSAIVRYVDSNQDSVNAGRALGVEAVLEGTLQREGDRVRITLRLLNVANGAQLWAGSFDEATADIFKLQDSISRQVGETLFTDLSPDEKALLVKQQSTNPEAYAICWKCN